MVCTSSLPPIFHPIKPITMTEGLSLSQLIRNVADELRLVQKEFKDQQDVEAVMAFQECELELQVQINAEANAGIKFFIIDTGVKASHQTMHTIKVKFAANSANSIIARNESEGNADKPKRNIVKDGQK